MKITGVDGDIIASDRNGAYRPIGNAVLDMVSKLDNAVLNQRHSGSAYWPDVYVDLHSPRHHVTVTVPSQVVALGDTAIIADIRQQLIDQGFTSKQIDSLRCFCFVNVADIWTDYQY